MFEIWEGVFVVIRIKGIRALSFQGFELSMEFSIAIIIKGSKQLFESRRFWVMDGISMVARIKGSRLLFKLTKFWVIWKLSVLAKVERSRQLLDLFKLILLAYGVDQEPRLLEYWLLAPWKLQSLNPDGQQSYWRISSLCTLQVSQKLVKTTWLIA